MKSYGALFLIATSAAIAAYAAELNVTSTADNGPGSLRTSLAAAGNGDTINATDVSGTILLTSGELIVGKSVTILGPGQNILAVDGNASNRVFHIDPGLTVVLSGLTITNGYLNPAALTSLGGGIYNDHAFLTVRDCSITGSRALEGGGIFNDGASGSAALTLSNCFVLGNLAPVGGGGIFNNSDNFGSANLTVAQCVIGGNSATNGSGGGLMVSCQGGDNGLITVVGTQITNNMAFDGGGGVYVYHVDLTDDYDYGPTSILQNCQIVANRGGGIYNAQSDMTLDRCTIASNSLTNGWGGGIFNDSNGGTFYSVATLTIKSSTICSNVAVVAGGIYNDSSLGGEAILTIETSTLSGNVGSVYAGGIYNSSGDTYAFVDIDNCTFNNNSSPAIVSGGVAGTASIGINNSIVNAGPSGVTLAISSGYFGGSFNLFSDGFHTFGGQGNQSNTDPLLGPLQDNGGPTWTHALLRGSPAIDKGTNFIGSATDQRGQPRTYDNPGLANAAGGDGTDIGAVEFIPPALGINPNYGNVILSWPASESGYTVESTTLLGDSAIWTTVTGTPIIIGDQHLLGDGPATGNRFYRLRSP